MSSSGKGQSIIDQAAEIEAAWNTAASGSRVNERRVIVEGVIQFDYAITQLTVRAINSEGKIVHTSANRIGHIQIQGDYVESWQPPVMSPQALQRSREIAQKLLRILVV
tara:strand:- start:1152 stop:1478 length:327 start_codon:yes stop_codon:yes gene_type:complete